MPILSLYPILLTFILQKSPLWPPLALSKTRVFERFSQVFRRNRILMSPGLVYGYILCKPLFSNDLYFYLIPTQLESECDPDGAWKGSKNMIHAAKLGGLCGRFCSRGMMTSINQSVLFVPPALDGRRSRDRFPAVIIDHKTDRSSCSGGGCFQW